MRKIIFNKNSYKEDCIECMENNESLFVTIDKRDLDKYDFEPDEPSLIMFTSGTTSEKKPTIIPWIIYKKRLKSIRDSFGDDFKNFYAPIKVNIETSTFASEYYGIDTNDIEKAEIILIFNKNDITRLDLIKKVNSLKKAKKLKYLIFVGYLLSNKHWKEISSLTNAKVITLYSSKETGNIARTDGEEVKDGLLGKPLPGVSIKIVNGEIWVKTPGMATTYYGKGMNLIEGWYNTKDRGYIKDDKLYMKQTRRIFLDRDDNR